MTVAATPDPGLVLVAKNVVLCGFCWFGFDTPREDGLSPARLLFWPMLAFS